MTETYTAMSMKGGDTATFTEALRHFRATTDTALLLDGELDGLRDHGLRRPVEL
jgi:hypothetical protein